MYNWFFFVIYLHGLPVGTTAKKKKEELHIGVTLPLDPVTRYCKWKIITCKDGPLISRRGTFPVLSLAYFGSRDRTSFFLHPSRSLAKIQSAYAGKSSFQNLGNDPICQTTTNRNEGAWRDSTGCMDVEHAPGRRSQGTCITRSLAQRGQRCCGTGEIGDLWERARREGGLHGLTTDALCTYTSTTSMYYEREPFSFGAGFRFRLWGRILHQWHICYYLCRSEWHQGEGGPGTVCRGNFPEVTNSPRRFLFASNLGPRSGCGLIKEEKA